MFTFTFVSDIDNIDDMDFGTLNFTRFVVTVMIRTDLHDVHESN